MDEYLRVSDAAKRTGLNRKTIYRWLHEGKILKRYIREFPNGMIAINVKGLTRPKRKVGSGLHAKSNNDTT